MAEKHSVRMLNAESGGKEIEIVARSFTIGYGSFGWVSYKGQRCKVAMCNFDQFGAQAIFEAWYYPSKGKWK